MIKMNDVEKIIDINRVVKEINDFDKSDPNFSKYINDYLNNLYHAIEYASLEIQVATLDTLFNISPSITYLFLLNNKDENLFRAQLVIELLKGVYPSKIRSDLEEANDLNNLALMYGGKALSERFEVATKYSSKIYDLLYDYLKNKEDDTIDDITTDDLIWFSRGLDKVHTNLFNPMLSNLIPSRNTIINSIFTNESIDEETLNNIYKNVLLVNDSLKDFDYTEMLDKNPMLITKVEGLFRKCNDVFFDKFSNENMNEDDFIDLDDMFKTIVELNQNDKEGLEWFFKEISKRFDKSEDTNIKILETFENVKK